MLNDGSDTKLSIRHSFHVLCHHDMVNILHFVNCVVWILGLNMVNFMTSRNIFATEKHKRKAEKVKLVPLGRPLNLFSQRWQSEDNSS